MSVHRALTVLSFQRSRVIYFPKINIFHPTQNDLILIFSSWNGFNPTHVLYFQKRGRLRPSSAPTYSRGGVGVGGKENAVLYKVFVTTADKKAAGTDAKVRNCPVTVNNFLSVKF